MAGFRLKKGRVNMIYVMFFMAALALGLAIISIMGRGQLYYLRFISGLAFIVLGVMWNTTEVTATMPRGSQGYGAILIFLIVAGIILMVSTFNRSLTMRKTRGDGGTEEWHVSKFPPFFENAMKSSATKHTEKRQLRQDSLNEYQARFHRALNPEGKSRWR